MIGRILGEYRIIEEIGRGGMGVVYLAEHQRLKKKYALKVLPEALAKSRSFVERFHIEARVMADLDHRHIVKVHTLGKSDGYYYLAMDYITADRGRAGSLQDEVAQRGQLPEKEVKGILLQVLSALDYAHNYRGEGAPEGVVHRDLKPSNILLGKGGRFLVSDFGLARVIGAEYIHSRIEQSISRSIATARKESAGHDSILPAEDKSIGAESTLPGKEGKRTSTGSILGTYDYMSPEQKEGEEADERSDIYAVGVLAYQMLTGEKLTGFPEPPSRIVKGIDKRWDKIIQKCLQKSPPDRYQSAAALIADIRRIGRSIRPMIRLTAIVVVLIAAGLFVTQRGKIIKPSPKKKPSVEKISPEKVVSKKPAGEQKVTPTLPLPETTPKFTGVTITSTPPGAKVYIGAELKGTTPIKELKLNPGSYSLVMEKEGYSSIIENLVVEAGKKVKINRNLSVITGSVEVRTQPEGVKVYLDGKAWGTSPGTIPEVVVGAHEITLKHKDYYEKKIKVEVKEEQTAKIEATLPGLPGRILVISRPQGAKVYINGRDSGKETTATLDNISPGQVEIKVEKQGYRTETRKDTLKPNSSLTFNFILTRAAPQGLKVVGTATDLASGLPLKITYGWLGVSLLNLNPDLAKKFGVSPEQKGALVGGVIENSPAAKAGLKQGDIITEVEDKKISTRSELLRVIGRTAIGKKAEVKIFRDSKARIVTVKIGARPSEPGDVVKVQEPWRGIRVLELTEELAKKLGLSKKEGVIVSEVKMGSLAYEAGLRSGNVIDEINRIEIKDLEDYRKIIKGIGSEEETLVHTNRGYTIIEGEKK